MKLNIDALFFTIDFSHDYSIRIQKVNFEKQDYS